MNLLAVSFGEIAPWVTWTLGVVGGVIGLINFVLQRRDARRAEEERSARLAAIEREELGRLRQLHEAAQAAERPQPAIEREAEQVRSTAEQQRSEVERKSETELQRDTRNRRAIVAVVFAALALLALLTFVDQTATAEELQAAVGAAVLYGGIAIVLGISGLRNVRRNPWKKGRYTAFAALAGAGLAILGAVGLASDESVLESSPDLAVAFDCTSVGAENLGAGDAAAFDLFVQNLNTGGSAGPFRVSGLSAGQSWATGLPTLPVPGSVVRATADAGNEVAESDEGNNAVQTTC